MGIIAGILLLGGIEFIKAIADCFLHPVNYHYICPFVDEEYFIFMLGHHPMRKYWEYFFRTYTDRGDRIVIVDDYLTLVQFYASTATTHFPTAFFENGFGEMNLSMKDGLKFGSLSWEEQQYMDTLIDRKKW